LLNRTKTGLTTDCWTTSKLSLCLLVPRLCLGMPIERLCLESSPSEAEPLDIGSQAEPRNQLGDIGHSYCMNKIAQKLAKSTA